MIAKRGSSFTQASVVFLCRAAKRRGAPIDVCVDRAMGTLRKSASTNGEMHSDDGPTIVEPIDERARAILQGFRIDWMNMSDAYTGEVLWQDNNWGDLLTERDIHIPKAILQCRAVSREFQFSSVEMLQGLRLEQRIFFRGGLMEQWHFNFGFVIPNSTNTWQQTIEAAEESKMLPAAALE